MIAKLPDGWATAAIEILGEWEGGGTPSKAVPQYWDGDIPWVSPKDMKSRFIAEAEDHITREAIANSATTLLPVGTVLMVTRSGILAHTFPVGVTRTEVTINQDLKALIPHAGLEGEFIAWALRRFEQDILKECTKHGTTVYSAETPRLKRFEIPIAPTKEQRRIVDKIAELFSDIEEGERALERARKLLDRYRQAVLKAAVSGELTKDWREKHKGEIESGEALLSRILKARRAAWEQDELAKMRAKGKEPSDDRWKEQYTAPKPPQEIDLPGLPVGWVWASLDQLLCKIEAGNNFRCEERPPTAEEFGVVKVSAVTWGTFDETQSKTVKDISLVDPTILIQRGDFLFSRANTIELVGACVLVHNVTNKNLLLSDKILRFVFAHDIGSWVEMALKSVHGRQQIEALSSGNQESMRNITQMNIRRIAIPLPPRVEMYRLLGLMVSSLSARADLDAELERSMQRLIALRQSILTAAFSGKLVPQDPRDEPASALLSRIRAERAAAGKPAPRLRGRRPGKVGKSTDELKLPLA